jgi:lipopolysaccharide export system permease protein
VALAFAAAVHCESQLMKTLGLLIQREILKATLWSLGGFAALLTFFDLLDELKSIGQPSLTRPGEWYQLADVAAYLALGLPSHAYTLLPICLLIGGVFVMARLAQQSEFTVLRMGGLGPFLALRTVLLTGSLLAVTTFVLGDYVVPLMERQQALLKANYQGNISIGRTGAWMRERIESGNVSLNVASLNVEGQPQRLRIFEFDAQGRLQRDISADSAVIDDGNSWTLINAQVHTYPSAAKTGGVTIESRTRYNWPTTLTTGMISAELLKNNRMSTLDLYQYIRHLQANDQNAQRFEIEFWRKLFYPLSCLVMVVMVLPFAYLHFRRGGIAGYVFLGVMTGISFYLLNNLFGFIGNINGWTPWLAAASPSLMYSAISLTAFAWLVAKR